MNHYARTGTLCIVKLLRINIPKRVMHVVRAKQRKILNFFTGFFVVVHSKNRQSPRIISTAVVCVEADSDSLYMTKNSTCVEKKAPERKLFSRGGNQMKGEAGDLRRTYVTTFERRCHCCGRDKNKRFQDRLYIFSFRWVLNDRLIIIIKEAQLFWCIAAIKLCCDALENSGDRSEFPPAEQMNKGGNKRKRGPRKLRSEKAFHSVEVQAEVGTAIEGPVYK